MVLINQDAATAAAAITEQLAPMPFPLSDPEGAQRTDRARKIFEGLQQGQIERSLFTDNANFYFNDTALKDFA